MFDQFDKQRLSKFQCWCRVHGSVWHRTYWMIYTCTYWAWGPSLAEYGNHKLWVKYCPSLFKWQMPAEIPGSYGHLNILWRKGNMDTIGSAMSYFTIVIDHILFILPRSPYNTSKAMIIPDEHLKKTCLCVWASTAVAECVRIVDL